MDAGELGREIAETATPEPYAYAGRVGIVLFALPGRGHAHDRDSELARAKEHYNNIVRILKADPRVKDLRAPAAEQNNFYLEVFSSAGKGENPKAGQISMPNRHTHGAMFADPILVNIMVPKRLQVGEGKRGVPAEEYWFAWDGVGLTVLWDHSASKNPTGMYGGFAAIDVLFDAGKKLNQPPLVEPCGPHCDYPFSHQDLLVAPSVDRAALLLSEIDDYSVRVDCPAEPDALELARRLSLDLQDTVHTFATMRGYADSVSRVESIARRDLTKVLRQQHSITAASAKPFFKSIPDRWKTRHGRREMASLLATLWVRLATLEENRRKWAEERYSYDSASEKQGLDLLFRTEYPRSVASVDTVEIDNLRSSVAQLTQRVDTRIIAIATVAGALAGAVVGGLASLVGVILTQSG